MSEANQTASYHKPHRKVGLTRGHASNMGRAGPAN
eukprot:CAMPEP_0171219514 /NCGR_PEP_ID=MMETSP0790-20130122/33757_1 /TAXON_ID=2925 /ORGANISM="Alexandrium catenella, Strain OF101" /LENGTH=34 /DNA_ID= /DNA_START= /DNA_END= /DNA_ORIENTATION=